MVKKTTNGKKLIKILDSELRARKILKKKTVHIPMPNFRTRRVILSKFKTAITTAGPK
jgi:hypothetical protein